MNNLLFGHQERWRVPNSVFLGLSFLVVSLTWTMLFIAYPTMPPSIPAHFGWSGVADATTIKTWWTVFRPAIFQLVLVCFTWWLSYHPQYSHLPTGLVINLIPEPTRGFVKHLLAHMLVMTGMLASLMMAYISLGMVRVTLGLTDRLNTLTILGLGMLLLLIIGVYTRWFIRLTKQLPKPEPTPTPT